MHFVTNIFLLTVYVNCGQVYRSLGYSAWVTLAENIFQITIVFPLRCSKHYTRSRTKNSQSPLFKMVKEYIAQVLQENKF